MVVVGDFNSYGHPYPRLQEDKDKEMTTKATASKMIFEDWIFMRLN